MSKARIQLNATILPSGRVLFMGGSSVNDDENTASLTADLFDPATNSFSPASANTIPRVYHSGSLLLPDATVMLAGGNRTRRVYQSGIEIYSPAYLFDASGAPAVRPVIGPTPDAIGYGQVFQIQTTAAASVQSIVLVRPGAQTHAFDMDQRLVQLSFTTGSDLLNVTAPPHGNIAPPGYYMLFILNAAGVPSHAKFVMLSGSVNQPPTATIVAPASNVTVNPGESVAFAGIGTDTDGVINGYSWTFPTGNPGSSTEANPSVTFSTPGTQTVLFRVTDDDGAISQAVTRSVTVANFSLSATPNSQTIAPGDPTSYTVTVAPQNGFTGNVSFGVTGLPTGATPTFSPASVAGSGATTLAISTTTSVQAGTYPLVITGTSGPVTRTANVTLVLAAPVNQAPTATIVTPESNVTVNPGGSVTFAGTGNDPDGTISGYSWTFPTGNPLSSTEANASVTFSTPGTQTVSFRVTDDDGATSQPVTRSVTVANFSLSSTPTSQTIAPGGAASYSVTVAPQNGFTGIVSLAVSGLPAAAIGSFSPPTVTGAGATTLSISTTTAIAAGTYPLVITGTSGPVTRTVNATLVVNGDFTVVAGPPTITIDRDANATYSVAVSSSGFSGTVLFSVSGLPKFAVGKFNPTSVVNAGNTVLTVSTNKKVSAGTYPLTITATSGSVVRPTSVILVIR
jgi:PKD repeat protein